MTQPNQYALIVDGDIKSTWDSLADAESARAEHDADFPSGACEGSEVVEIGPDGEWLE